MSKQIFIQQVEGVVTDLAQKADIVESMAKVFTDRGYASNGTDPITDLDLQNAGSSMTATQFMSVAVILAEYVSFVNNVACTAKDRKAVFSLARKDM